MTSAATIGALRHRLTLEAPVDVPDELGGFTRSFAPVAQLWARIEALGGNEQFIEQQIVQTRRYAVKIRWRPDVANEMRFVFRGRKLVIRNVEDSDEGRRFLKCVCEEFS